MKKVVLLCALFAAALSSGCDKIEGAAGDTVSTRAQDALLERYPSATNVTWEMKGTYAVADFLLVTVPNTAWFDNDGTWYMTETDIRFEELPEPVRTAFLAGPYGSWKVDDVDRLEREGVETVYVIEAEQGEREMDLYYSPDGVLLKEVADEEPDYDYGDFIPDPVTDAIRTYIASHYPEARIVEIDAEEEGIEVDIVDGGFCRELLFTVSGEWVRTKTEVRPADVPQLVMQALASSPYASYYIDDVDLYETPQKVFYRFDLESAQGDVEVDITLDGELTVADGSEGGTGAGLPQAILDFIAEKYPGAAIIDTDREQGMLEVEIMHENREKNVYFDGSDRWVATTWGLIAADLPAEVTAAVQASEYAAWELDDIDFVQTPEGEYYLLEFESGDREATLRVDASGRIL